MACPGPVRAQSSCFAGSELLLWGDPRSEGVSAEQVPEARHHRTVSSPPVSS